MGEWNGGRVGERKRGRVEEARGLFEEGEHQVVGDVVFLGHTAVELDEAVAPVEIIQLGVALFLLNKEDLPADLLLCNVKLPLRKIKKLLACYELAIGGVVVQRTSPSADADLLRVGTATEEAMRLLIAGEITGANGRLRLRPGLIRKERINKGPRRSRVLDLDVRRYG